MNSPINYELKITKTMYNGSSYRYCFYVPVKGGFITQFKKLVCVVNGDRFTLVLGNDEAAIQKHVNVVSSGTAIAYKTPFMAMYRQGNAMTARVTGGKINAEVLDSLLGEYSNSTVVYRGVDGYVLAYRCAHRHNFDNTKSNATDVTVIPVVGGTMTKPDGTVDELGPGFIGHRKDMNPVDEMADETPKTVDIPDGFSEEKKEEFESDPRMSELDINKLIEGIKERRESLGEEQYKTIKRREEWLRKVNEAKKKEKETREIDPKDKALETFRKIMKEQIHSVIDSMCDASDDILLQIYHGIVCGALECYGDMLKNAIKEDK